MAEQVAVLARRWFEEVWNARREEAVEEMMAADAVGHMEGGDVRGPEEFRKARSMFLTAFPDMYITLEDVVSEGDRAAVRWRVQGTHAGELLGVPASERRIDVRGTSWFMIRDGKLDEGWDTWNLGGLVESLK